MGLIGTRQRESLSSSVADITASGSSISYGGTPIDDGASLAALLEKDAEANAGAIRIIISQLEAIAQVWRFYNELPNQERPDWEPRAIVIDLTTPGKPYVSW